MKVFIIIALTLIVSASYAQVDCKPYVPTSKGTKWEITNYSSKGKETGKTSYELVDKVDTDNGATFTIEATSYGKKEDVIYTNRYDAHCKNGEFEFDMAFKIDGAALQSYQSMDVDVNASNFEIPTMDEIVGTTLKDGSLVLKIGASNVTMFKMTVLVTDRKVEAKEDKTTPAGTFKCMVLSQKVSTKMMVKVEGSSKEWYAEGIGLIRSESYNKKGKLTRYSELTKLEKE